MCSDLKLDNHCQSSDSLVQKEALLLQKKVELLAIKAARMAKFQSLLDQEDTLCERLYEYKLNLDAKLTPTEHQLDTLQQQIDELHRIKRNRMKEFLARRLEIVHYLSVLEQSPSSDAFVNRVCADEHAADVPLSIDCLTQCERWIDQLRADVQTNIAALHLLRQKRDRLRTFLYGCQNDEVSEGEGGSYRVLETVGFVLR